MASWDIYHVRIMYQNICKYVPSFIFILNINALSQGFNLDLFLVKISSRKLTQTLYLSDMPARRNISLEEKTVVP